MVKCSKCGSVLIRAGCYDPDGTIPLKGEIKYGYCWVCINPVCEQGKENREV